MGNPAPKDAAAWLNPHASHRRSPAMRFEFSAIGREPPEPGIRRGQAPAGRKNPAQRDLLAPLWGSCGQGLRLPGADAPGYDPAARRAAQRPPPTSRVTTHYVSERRAAAASSRVSVMGACDERDTSGGEVSWGAAGRSAAGSDRGRYLPSGKHRPASRRSDKETGPVPPVSPEMIGACPAGVSKQQRRSVGRNGLPAIASATADERNERPRNNSKTGAWLKEAAAAASALNPIQKRLLRAVSCCVHVAFTVVHPESCRGAAESSCCFLAAPEINGACSPRLESLPRRLKNNRIFVLTPHRPIHIVGSILHLCRGRQEHPRYCS